MSLTEKAIANSDFSASSTNNGDVGVRPKAQKPPVISHPASCSEDDGKGPVPTPELVFGTSFHQSPVRQFQDHNGIGLPTPVIVSTVPDIQALANANPHKAGIAFLCVSTGDPCSRDFIANCTALEKMEDCLGTKLGYLTISVGTNMTTSQLDSLISQLAMLKLPEKYKRVIAYFFGHGNDDSLQFADGFVEREHIISKFQLISPTNANVFNIFIFDSCRMVNGTTCKGIQESSDCKALAGESWEAKGQYPESVNTLVINATTCNNKAYYRESDGCGFLTKFFTELAPTRNESLRDLLAVIRQKIAHETQMETLKTIQILVYEDKVMGIINLLAESQGTARVAPTHVSASPSILSTNVHWRFDDKVQAQIQQFYVEISSAMHEKKLPEDRMAAISGLGSGTAHSVRVIAVYKDGTKAMSEIDHFITPIRNCPSNIEVNAEYPGSPHAKITWSFPGESSDLTHFHVDMKPEGKGKKSWNTLSTKREIDIDGLQPSMPYQISVIAVYQDTIEMKHTMQLRHSDISSHRLCSGLCYGCTKLFLVLFSLVLIIMFMIYSVRISQWNPNESRAMINGINDTVLVTEVKSTHHFTQVDLKLSGLTNFSFQPVNIYSTPCDKLSSHNSTVNFIHSTNMPVNSPDIVMLSTYLVNGSSIEVLTFILDTSVIDVDITFYIFEGLDGYYNYASHYLDKSAYQATVYTSGPGMQNTSTLVNYTIQSTDYYFVVIDSNAPVIAQFDITLHKQLYHESDYKQVCSITDSAGCSLPISKHECVDILAHSTHTHDLKWLPVQITVSTFDSSVLSTITVMSILSVCLFVTCCCLRCSKCFKRSLSQKHSMQQNL